ncbi:MAG TPA: HlyD family secretion protein [Tepidisphaeraceae bacterium]|nr:HlyD family secretion protein [Tepidisphaeraceae bacterium]
MSTDETVTPTESTQSQVPPAPPPRRRKGIIAVVAGLVLVIGLGGWYASTIGTVSTDDAYVNGHVTFVAPRVTGQVAQVLVDDNNRVHKGDLLVQLDKEPFEVQAQIADSAVRAAESDLTAAQAQARAMAGQARGLRFNLEHAIEEVDNQVALLRSKVATLNSQKATLEKARSEYERALNLIGSKAVSQQDMDTYKEAFLVAQAKVEEATQGVYQVRASLGLSPKPENGEDLSQVPEDLDQTFSSVRQAQAGLIQAAAVLGVSDSFNKSPKQMLADFYKRDPEGNIDRIYADLIRNAPLVKQAESKLVQAQHQLDQAKLNLSYTDVVAEIDGVVTRRSVNPGNNVVAGQSLMAVRSLTDIWIDANFKETQLSALRIGLPVDVDVDMYGGTQRFKGRITGFTMGTGSTLALLPAENATGNFVKVVQRLPVRIELTDYDPDKTPLFIGLSVTPRVHVNERPAGAFAGAMLQPYMPTTAPAYAVESRR